MVGEGEGEGEGGEYVYYPHATVDYTRLAPGSLVEVSYKGGWIEGEVIGPGCKRTIRVLFEGGYTDQAPGTLRLSRRRRFE